jgi:hypothetical protein
VFGHAYPDDFQELNVTIDYPARQQDYPAVWVNFDDSGSVRRAGINHKEIVTLEDGDHEVTRWLFQGDVSFTVGALSSLERDRLYDALVGMIAFTNAGDEDGRADSFKSYIEKNDLIGINLNYDEVTASGDSASPGTPWETNEVIYEKTLSVELIGEFVSTPARTVLVPLSAVLVQGYREGEPSVQFPDTPDDGFPHEPWSPTRWS